MKKKVIIYNPLGTPGYIIDSFYAYNGLTLAIPLLNAGYEVELFDANSDENASKELINSFDNDIICLGISAMTGYQIKDGLDVARSIKQLNSNITIVWGGPHPSLLPEQTLKHNLVDIIVRGQGTYTFLELVDALYYKKSLFSIKGIGFKEHNKIFLTEESLFKPLKEFNGYPFQLIKNIETKKWSTFNYNSSEGCPWNCGFCANKTMYKSRWFGYPVEPILRDIKYIINKTNLNNISFVDTNMFVDKKRIINFAEELIKQNIDIKWLASGRIDQFLNYSSDELKLIASSGLTTLLLGLESGSQRLLNKMNKNINVNKYLKGIEYLNSFNIKFAGLFMIGLPTETEEEMEETFNLMRIINDYQNGSIILAIYTPYPGSEMFKECVELGFEMPDSFEKWGDFTQDKINTTWQNPNIKLKFDCIIAELHMKKNEYNLETDLLAKEIKKEGNNNILIWGAALTGAYLLKAAEKNNLNVLGFIDNNLEKINKKWFEKNIFSFNDAPLKYADAIVIASKGYEREIIKQIKKEKNINCKIYGLLKTNYYD
ncbi:MAG TPA: radical SAM protein [bacterium]|nr:radical SAM protein [bacterium]HOL47271.1 radical SAM protein [bacterium]HPQ19636.1 radical SAM protein [bacterium]